MRSQSRPAETAIADAQRLPLLDGARDADLTTLRDLMIKEVPLLRRFAVNRVPRALRSRFDYDDFVQTAVLKMLHRLPHFNPARASELPAYMRKVLLNVLRDEIRRARGDPEFVQVQDEHANSDHSPADELFGRRAWGAYCRALAALEPRDRACIRLRLHKGLGYREIAAIVGIPTPDAARVAFGRALQRLRTRMQPHLLQDRRMRFRPRPAISAGRACPSPSDC